MTFPTQDCSTPPVAQQEEIEVEVHDKKAWVASGRWHLVSVVQQLIQLQGCIMAPQAIVQLSLELQMRDIPAWSNGL